MSRHFKGAACPGAGLLKNQRDILSLKHLVGNAFFLLVLEIRGEVEEILDLLRAEIQQFQKVSSFKIHSHWYSLSFLTSYRQLRLP